MKRIIDYRNQLTHHPVIGDQYEANRLELVRCNYVLQTLLELCFLKSMSIDAEDIKAIADKCFRYQQVRHRFFTP